MAIKLFIIDKLRTTRELIQSLLIDNNDITVLGIAESYHSYKTSIDLCDVLLIEHNPEMPETLDLIYEIRQQHPALKILLLSDSPQNPTFLNHLLMAGSSGYISKTVNRAELVYALKSVKDGGLHISTAFILKLLENYQLPKKDEREIYPSITLNAGEGEVLNLISKGLTNREIANELCTSVRTIEARRKKLLDKTNTTNTATLIKWCVKTGLLD